MLLKKGPALALLIWSILPWIKSEGQSLSLFLYMLMFLRYAYLRTWTIFAGFVLILPWVIWNRALGNNSSQYFQFDQIYERPWGEYIVYSLHSFREEFRYLDRWGLIFLITAFALLRNLKQILLSSRHMIILTAILLQLIIYVIIFTITPEEQASFITSAIARLTLHFAPAVIAISANILLEEHE